MRYLFSVLVAVGLFASIAIVGPRSAERDMTITSSIPAMPAPGADPDTFTLTSPDSNASCTVRKRQADPDGKVRLIVPAGCDAILPGLSAARYWIEGSDSTVSFRRESGSEIALFALADGNAYESVSPRRPMMALAAFD